MILTDSTGVRVSNRKTPRKSKGGVWRLACEGCGKTIREGDEPASVGRCPECEVPSVLPDVIEIGESRYRVGHSNLVGAVVLHKLDGSGSKYTVFPAQGTCGCKAAQYREQPCKHVTALRELDDKAEVLTMTMAPSIKENPYTEQPLVEGLWNVAGLAAYHADRSCESHSSLECFRDSAAAYNQIYNLHTLSRPGPSDSLKLGTALHAWVLETSRFDDLVAVIPAGTERRSNNGKADWAKFLEDNLGKTIIDGAQFELVNAMGLALRHSPIAGPLVFDAAGENEVAIRWHDSDSGVWLKACFDRLLDCGMDLNLKTSRNPCPKQWAKDSVNFGYERQSALYRAGKQAVIGSEQSFHVVVGTEPPHLVGVFELGDAELDLGRAANVDTLQRLAFCRETEDWSDAWENEITTINYPRWAFFEAR